jgi:hypothetical protein
MLLPRSIHRHFARSIHRISHRRQDQQRKPRRRHAVFRSGSLTDQSSHWPWAYWVPYGDTDRLRVTEGPTRIIRHAGGQDIGPGIRDGNVAAAVAESSGIVRRIPSLVRAQTIFLPSRPDTVCIDTVMLVPKCTEDGAVKEHSATGFT